MEDAGDEVDEIDKDRWYLQRLDGGLYTLNAVDYILGWICMEDDGVCATSSFGRFILTRRMTGLRSCTTNAQAEEHIHQRHCRPFEEHA